MKDAVIRRLGHHVQLIAYFIIKGLIVGGFFYALYHQDWVNSAYILGIFVLTFVPSVVKAAYRIYFPIEFDLLLLFFIYATLFLGEIGDFYHKYWWWDLFMHGFSAMLLGIFGFILVFILNQEEKIHLGLKPFFIAFFACTFAISIGVFWEIFEYWMDNSFGLNMQKNGLVDTMEDLIVDCIGAFTMSTIGYLWMKKKISFYVFDVSLRKFVRRNANVFFPKKSK